MRADLQRVILRLIKHCVVLLLDSLPENPRHIRVQINYPGGRTQLVDVKWVRIGMIYAYISTRACHWIQVRCIR